ncbi:hypothetical protein JMUB7476_27600 [Staphylococcus aureus]
MQARFDRQNQVSGKAVAQGLYNIVEKLWRDNVNCVHMARVFKLKRLTYIFLKPESIE